MVNQDINRIKDYIQEADAVLIAAGSGMSVDSGLPDFRGKNGFWKAYPFFEKLDIDFMDVASPQQFFSNPDIAWAFYGHRLDLYRKTQPHVGFNLLLDLVRSKKNNYFVYTSNVDGHFQKTGFDINKIYEVHGSINYLQCALNCNDEIWNNHETINVNQKMMTVDKFPRCKNCGGISRPNILMFDDYYWVTGRTDKQNHKYNKWLHNTVIAKNQKLVIIEIGCGITIQTVRMNNEWMMKKYSNTKLIRINPYDNHIDIGTGWSIRQGALEALENLL